MIELISGLVALITLVLGVFIGKSRQKKIEQLTIEKLKYEIEEHKRDKADQKIKLDFLNRIMDLEFINQISEAVNEMFNNTKVDRFLILVAKNGVTDFNVVSVVFEAHKKAEYRINAIARYRNVHVDNAYKEMLKEAEFKGVVQLETETMPDGILKDFYQLEGVTFSKVRHLARKPIDGNNDFLVYSSVSTHENSDFDNLELAFIKTQFEGIIMPSINKIFD